MSIPLELLTLTGGEALGFVVYGGAGTRKTNGIHTLPPPILVHDWDKGITSILPWIRRIRQYDDSEWTTYTQEMRQQAFDLLNDQAKGSLSIACGPYIDVVRYDNMEATCFNQWKVDSLNINPNDYNSVVCDSLQEHTGAIKNAYKGQGKELDEMNNIYWGAVQDKSVSVLRYYRNLRRKGVFIYITCSEDVDKQYVNDPRSKIGQDKDKNQKTPSEAPYAVKGTVNVSGQVVQAVQHTTDIMLHARAMGQSIVWVKDPESIGGGSGAVWEAKDRTGRMKETYNEPNIRKIMDQIYGEEIRKKIYTHARKSMLEVVSNGA